MRLWHKDLLPLLPRAQLLGQHRECCALRGKGWGRPHSTVNYVWQYPYGYLFRFHRLVMDEMERRGYRIAPEWQTYGYRGKRLGYSDIPCRDEGDYSEHNDDYLRECLENLAAKGVVIEMGGVA